MHNKTFVRPIENTCIPDEPHGGTDDGGARSDAAEQTEASPDAAGQAEASADTVGQTGTSPDTAGQAEASPDAAGQTGASPDPAGQTKVSPDATGQAEASADAVEQTEQTSAASPESSASDRAGDLPAPSAEKATADVTGTADIVDTADTAEKATVDAAGADTADVTEATDTAETVNVPAPSVSQLLSEIAGLRERLDRAEKERTRIAGEIAEFRTLYPDVSPASLPESVWDSFSAGVPLAASYALAERYRVRAEELARGVNERNRAEASPATLRAPRGGMYTPEEVRAMSGEEVRTHYAAILDSMKHWGS